MRPRRAAKLLNETTLARCAARNSGSRCAVSAKCPMVAAELQFEAVGSGNAFRWGHDAGVVDQQVDRPPVSHELFPQRGDGRQR